MDGNRYVWLDWMKVLGMYFIVLGHFFPQGYKYIYTFSVPVFFFLSGFLSKCESNISLFWNKLFFNLLVPAIMMCSVMYFWEWYLSEMVYCERFPNVGIYIYRSIIGDTSFLGTCWFIYTLFLIKVLHQYIEYYKLKSVYFLFLFSIVAIYLDYLDFHRNNAFLDMVIAYPVFLLGYYAQLSKIKNMLNISYLLVIAFICSLLIIFICGKYNEEVWMFKNEFGSNYLLFLLGTIGGVVMLFVTSIAIGDFMPNLIRFFSKGNIIILGFHGIPVYLFDLYFPKEQILYPIYALIIMIAFYPIILFSRTYFPYLMGIKRK